MTILIDQPIWQGHGRLWSHLVSDQSLDELHEFAVNAGLPERAFHRDHYDVPAERFDEVIASGARSSTSREVVRALYKARLRPVPGHGRP